MVYIDLYLWKQWKHEQEGISKWFIIASAAEYPDNKWINVNELTNAFGLD